MAIRHRNLNLSLTETLKQQIKKHISTIQVGWAILEDFYPPNASSVQDAWVEKSELDIYAIAVWSSHNWNKRGFKIILSTHDLDYILDRDYIMDAMREITNELSFVLPDSVSNIGIPKDIGIIRGYEENVETERAPQHRSTKITNKMYAWLAARALGKEWTVRQMEKTNVGATVELPKSRSIFVRRRYTRLPSHRK